jgi:2-C-methyl-D-erythritol 4-phosphate cytidylyltransferase
LNIALIIAGGNGKRTNQEIPKQFINVFNKPIIIYTLEAFQKHPKIDRIEVVIIKGWEEVLKAYARQYKITKLKYIIAGGETAQESIRNGVFNLKSICNKNDNIIIHDGIRPIIEESVISNLILVCESYGNAVSSLPYNEQIFIIDDQISTKKYVPRNTLKRVQTPQAYKFSKLAWAYETAFEQNIGIGPGTYTNTLMVDLGEKLFFSEGSDKNIKITTLDDLEIFMAMVKSNDK